MDLSPAPFWIKKHHKQTLVFDFTNVSNQSCFEEPEVDLSEVLNGKSEHVKKVRGSQLVESKRRSLAH